MSALPQETNYLPKMPSVRSRALTVNVVPTNGATFSNDQDQIILDVGCGSYGQYMNQQETYLKFKVKNTNGTDALQLDRDCSTLFSRITISHGSQIIEDISEVNVLNRMFQDCQIGPNKQTLAGSVTRGHGEGTVGSGEAVFPSVSIGSNATETFCMSLLSGVVGPQCPKYLPLGAMGAGGNLRITLTLDNLNNCCRSAGATDVALTISDVNLVVGIIELDQAGQQMVDASSSGLYAISSIGYKNYTVSGGGNSETNLELLVPAKASSMKALYAITRPQAHLNKRQEFCIGNRERAGMSNYHLSIAGQRYPAGKPIETNGDAFEQLMKTFGGVNNVLHEVDFGKTRWELDTSAPDTNNIETKGAYVSAIELESFGQSSEKIESGVNTLGSNMFFNCEFVSTGITEAQHFSFFSVYDVLLTVEGGILQTKF